MLLAWIGLKPRRNMVQLNKTVTSCATVCRCHTVVGADEQELDRGCQQKRFSFFFFFFLSQQYITAEGQADSGTSVLVAREQDMNN